MASLFADAAAVEFGGSEPWPDDVRLFQPYEHKQVLLSDFATCLSVKAFLNMCGLHYQVEHRVNTEQMSPSGKVPFLKAGPFIVSEFQPIIAYAGVKGHSLSSHLSDMEKADMRAYMGLVDNYLGNAQIYLCFNIPEIYNEITHPRCGASHSWPLTVILPYLKCKAALKHLSAVEWRRKSQEEVWEEVQKCCQALSEKLGDQDFFFGDSPTDLDALVYGHLFTMITTQLPMNKFAEILETLPNLTNFIRRVDERYFDGQQERS